MGRRAAESGEVEEAKRLLKEGQILHQALNNPYGLIAASVGLSSVARQEGDFEQARAHLKESRRLNHGVRIKPLTVSILFESGRLALAEGDYAQGHTYLRQALASYNELGDKLSLAAIFEVLVELVWRQGDASLALQFAGVAAKLHTTLGTVPMPVDRANLDRILATTRRRLGDEQADQAWAEGEALPLDEAITMARQR